MSDIRLYFRYIGISFRSQMQYKASFVMYAFANAANSMLEFLTIFAFFNRFGGLDGWTLHEVALLYGMVIMAYGICEAWMRGFDTFQNMIRNAEFDRILVRPRSTVLQVLGSSFQLLRIGRLSVGVGALWWSIASMGLNWGFAQWALLILSILGGAMLFSALILVQATSCFWTIETLEVFNTVTYGGVETCQYPLSIYHDWLKRFFMYVVPLAAINYWPCSELLSRGYAPAALSYLSPLIGPVFYVLGLHVWRFGVKHYRSTGS